jgi:hypothetical protein
LKYFSEKYFRSQLLQTKLKNNFAQATNIMAAKKKAKKVAKKAKKTTKKRA